MSGTLPIQLAQLTLELVLDVERRLPRALAAVVARGQQLADLVVALGDGGGRGRGRSGGRRLVAHREGAAADVVVGLARDSERDERHHAGDGDHREDDHAESLLHAYILATCGASSEERRWPRVGRSSFRSSTGWLRSRRWSSSGRSCS